MFELDDKEKLIAYLAIALVSILLIAVIIMIWTPSNNNSIENSLNKYNVDSNYESKRVEFYQNNIINMLNTSNFNSLYNNIDSDFLSEYNLDTSEKAYNYLQKNLYIGSNIELNDIVLIDKTNDIYLFKVTYSIEGNTRYVIVQEAEVNKYTFYFSETGFVKNIFSEKSVINENVEYKINTLESTNDSIKLRLTITNNSQDRYEFDFSNLYSVRIITEENEGYNLASVVLSGNEIYYLNPNSSFSIELVYQIPQEKQAKIERMLFTDVIVNDVEKNINIYY